MTRDGTNPKDELRKHARTYADTTIAIPIVHAPPPPAPSADMPEAPVRTAVSISQAPLYSYKPHAGRNAPDPSRIAPSETTVGAILENVRKAPADRHEIESRIAAGGMGVVDIAIDRALDRRVALKTLHPHLRSDESALRMFLREARLTGLLDHPHIVPVYDLGERASDSSLYFAMKLVEGRSLAAIRGALPRGPLDTANLYTLLDVIAKVCDALAFAHSRGVLHCDVKPANIMVGEFGQVFLMDWGIARLIAPDTADLPPSARDAAIVGTPGYMSPEQARGERHTLDVRSDVFLLGATLYELVTHRAPYARHGGEDRHDMLELAAACAFPAPRKVAGEAAVPLELERIILRAMAKRPEARYPTIAALKEDLVRFMRGGVEFPRRTLQAGDVIVREGDPGDEAYIVVEGRCAVQRSLKAGPQTVQTLGPGDVFGETAILAHGPRTATVVATEPTTVLIVTSHVLEQEMAALKPWMARILTSLAARFRDADAVERATLPTAAPAPARIANQVLMTLLTWGDDDGQGGRSMSWTTLAAELEAQLALAPATIFGVVHRYEMVLDLDADRLTIPNVDALRTHLVSDLTDTGKT